MSHWARDIISKPWSPGGDGPDSFSCWGLVRYAFRVKHGIELPMVTLGEPPSQVHQRNLMRAARETGWRPSLLAAPMADDVVVMWSNLRTHVGIVERANGWLGVLHCAHDTGVVFQSFADVTSGMRYEMWRRVR